MAALSCYAVAVKLNDDLRDHPTRRVRLLRALYANTFDRARSELVRLGFPVSELEEAVAQQDVVERSGTGELDEASEPTGRAYAIVARFLAPAWLATKPTEQVGEALGRCVYVIDAYRDIQSDDGVSYNPLCCGRSSAESQLSSRRRKARAYIADRLAAARNSLNDCTSILQGRWPSIERRVRSLVGLEPATVTLNATCCIPCGDGAVVADDSECALVFCGCFCCASCVCVKCFQ